MASGHFDYESLEERVDYAAEVAPKYTAFSPFLSHSEPRSMHFTKPPNTSTRPQSRQDQPGLSWGNHRHNYEYKPLGNETGFDILIRELDSSVELELDIYSAIEGGQNPMEIMRRYRESDSPLFNKGPQARECIHLCP